MKLVPEAVFFFMEQSNELLRNEIKVYNDRCINHRQLDGCE